MTKVYTIVDDVEPVYTTMCPVKAYNYGVNLRNRKDVWVDIRELDKEGTGHVSDMDFEEFMIDFENLPED